MFLSNPNSLFKYKCTSFSVSLRFLSNSSATPHLTFLLDRFLSTPIPDIKSLLQSHAFIVTTGHSDNLFIAAKLISFYSSFNKPSSSTQVFHSTNPKDTFLWNSIIKSHFSNGEYPSTLHFYYQMRGSGFLPTSFTIPMVVGASAELPSLEMGQRIHCLASKLGLLATNTAVGSSFVYMYSKMGRMEDAYKVFDEMSVRDVVTWTSLLVGYVQNDDNEKGLGCICRMHRIGGDEEKPNFRTIGGGLQACENLGAISSGRCIHGYALKTGFGCFPSVQSSLLSMYSKCHSVEEAHLAFCNLPDKDIISWTMVVGAYARHGLILECLKLFWEMQVSGMIPDGIIISCMLSGFANAGRPVCGKAFHGLIVRKNFECDQTVSNSLLSMYCKLGCLDIAEKLFDRLSERNKDCWSIMISGFGMMGLETKCLQVFRVMQHLGLESDTDTLDLVLSSCSRLVLPRVGQSIHCYVLKSMPNENISVTNLLLRMYGKFGNLATAERIFYMANKDIVTWNTLISAYIHNGRPSEALALFDKMVLADMEPNSVTMVTVLSACSHLADLDHGKRLHTCIKEVGLHSDLSVATAIVDMYVKCGELQIAREIFNMAPERDVVLWNVMISGYGIHGDAKSALGIFKQMEESGVKPNGLSFLAVLSACNHAGLIQEGRYLFDRMKDYSVVPTMKHYACIVDLLGRSGNLQEAETMIRSMPIDPDGGMWGALLGACKIHNDLETGKRVAEQAIESDPENDGYYIILSNMYSSLGKWEEAENVRRTMKNRGVRKKAGWSAT